MLQLQLLTEQFGVQRAAAVCLREINQALAVRAVIVCSPEPCVTSKGQQEKAIFSYR